MKPQQQSETENYCIVVHGHTYSYCIIPFILTNSLGFVRAHLKEYFVTGPQGEQYKLYKTIESNWYDVENANPKAGSGLLRDLKFAIDHYENTVPSDT